MTDMQPINRWVLYYEGRVVRPRPDLGLGFCPYLVDPPGAPQPPSPTMTVNYVGAEGMLVLSCPDGYAGNFQRVEPGYPAGVVFEDASSSYHLRPLPTGDGSFILGRADPSFPSGNNYLGYVVVLPGDHIPYDWLCLSLDVQPAQASRFTASGLDRASILDCVQVSLDANGMTFAGVDVTKADLSGSNLSGCDFRHVAGGSFGSCSVAGSHLQGASFSGLPMAGLQMSWSDCTGADFTGCDFTSMQTGGELPPVMASADLTGAVIPAGIPLGKTRDGVGSFAGALLANATLTGADLAGADLSGADLSGTGVSVFSPVFESSQGINDYDLLGEADRVIALDFDADAAHPKANYLVCYRPGRGACAILDRITDASGNVTFGHVYFQGDPGDGIGGYNLLDAADQMIAYDYDSTGNLGHLVCYRPGAGWISVIEKKTAADGTATFDKAWDSTSGIGGSAGCNLLNPADRIIAFDYEGTGHLDHLLCYRPGTGQIWILEKDSDVSGNVTFTAVFSSTDGIGGYPLTNAGDLIIAVGGANHGHLDHLLCYRPGSGTVLIAEKRTASNSAVTFASIFASSDGIGGCDLSNPGDQIIAFDYTGTGNPDHLLCYRPAAGMALTVTNGTISHSGTVWILKEGTDQQNHITFTPVYHKTTGIGGYDLSDPTDRVIAYDYAGTGAFRALVCYRPGTGTVWVIPGEPARPARLTADAAGHVCDLSGTDLSSAHFAGTELNGVDLSGATLVGTDFTGTDLTRATFSTPLIRSDDPSNPTVFAGCTLAFATLGLDWSYLDLTSAVVIALPGDLTGLAAVSAQLTGFNFDGLILDGANFASATLIDAHFSLAKIRQPAGGQAPSFKGAVMTGTVLSGAVLDQVSFHGAVLGGVTSDQAANFSSAWISNCDFSDANAYAVVFAGATLVGGNTLTGVLDLQESDFSGAYLPNTSFNGASLQGADFDGACMIGCDLTDAQLGPARSGAKVASLDSACLQAAVFLGVSFDRASLVNAAITGQGGMIQVSHYDEDGSLVGPEPLAWRPHDLPGGGSFTDGTVCPNTLTYKDNTAGGKTIAQMMEAPNPPTKWVPVGRLRLPRRSPANRVLSGILPGLSGRRSLFGRGAWPAAGPLGRIRQRLGQPWAHVGLSPGPC